jgi:VanZ family protein
LDVIVINGQRRSGRGESSPGLLSPAGLRRLAIALGPPLIVMAMIFFFSAQPSDHEHRPLFEVLARKLGHVTGYFLLTLAWWWALNELDLSRSLSAQLRGAALFSLLYAATDEFHQTFVSGRTGTPVDVLIDAIGVGLACLLVTRLYARRRRRTIGPSRPRAA